MTSAIVYDNLADIGAVSASSWIASAPPALLQSAHVTRRWQGSNASSEFILATWNTPQTVDTVGLFGIAGIFQSKLTSLSSASTVRLRISSLDTTGLTGDVYDSGVVSGLISDKYSSFVHLQNNSSSIKAIRIDIAEAGAEAILAGRLVVGLRNPFSINFDFNWTFGFQDLSRVRKSAGGLTFVDKDDRFRVLNLSFGSLDPADRYGFVNELDRLNGISDDVLFIIDESSSDLNRDTIWGLLQDMSPPSQPNFSYFSKVFKIEERR